MLFCCYFIILTRHYCLSDSPPPAVVHAVLRLLVVIAPFLDLNTNKSVTYRGNIHASGHLATSY